MRIGEAFRLTDDPTSQVRGRAAKSAATARLMGRIAALLPPRQRGVYAGEVTDPGCTTKASR
jgi:hypothetical protein